MDDSQFLEGQNPERTAIVPAFESMLEIRDDLNDRSGFDLDALDEEVLEEILQAWVRIIEPKARKFAREKMLQVLGLLWAEKFPSEVLPSTELCELADRILPTS